MGNYTCNLKSVRFVTGVPTEELLDEMKKLKAQEINPEDGKMFAYVYTGEGDSFEAQRKAFDMFTGEDFMTSDLVQVIFESAIFPGRVMIPLNIYGHFVNYFGCYCDFCVIEKTGLNAEHDKLVRQFHHAFMHENALNPMIFPSLRYTYKHLALKLL